MNVDVVVVGGGVGGCALAARLAGAGHAVTVLEREATYRDLVRGEGMVPWGYQEVVALGLEEVLRETPGLTVITRMVPYDETLDVATARRAARDLTSAVPGSPGVIGVGHPELREALANAAVNAGATVLRGVRRAAVTAGRAPSVDYEHEGRAHTLSCRLVVVADGKNSSIRTQLGIPLSVTVPRVLLTGLLVDDGGAWDRAETTIGVDGRNQYIVVPRADDRIRLYVGRRTTDPDRFTGRDRIKNFLEAYRSPVLPHHDALADATPLGPCASFPMTDAWTDSPVIPGVALVGDAAGWSNPVTAQGLSITFRDARMLTDTLLASSDWSVAGLSGYAEERTTRMERLRFASALTDLLSAFGAPDRTRRRERMQGLLRDRPDLGAALAAVHSGPWAAPADAFTPDILTTLAVA